MSSIANEPSVEEPHHFAVEEDFLELDDLIIPQSALSNSEQPVVDDLPFDDVDEFCAFDFCNDSTMNPVISQHIQHPSYATNLEYGIENFDFRSYFNTDIQTDHSSWRTDQNNHNFTDPHASEHPFSAPSGVITNDVNQCQNTGEGYGGSGSLFSSALWDYVESVPASPAFALESSALVSKVLVQMPSGLSRSSSTKNGARRVKRSSRSSRMGILYSSVLGVLCFTSEVPHIHAFWINHISWSIIRVDTPKTSLDGSTGKSGSIIRDIVSDVGARCGYSSYGDSIKNTTVFNDGVFQSASLCLTTTTLEQLAFGLKWFMKPLKYIGVPVDEVILTLLLSLRFINLVFDEVRIVALGIVSRRINWQQLATMETVEVHYRKSSDTFDFTYVENVAHAFICAKIALTSHMPSKSEKVASSLLAFLSLSYKLSSDDNYHKHNEEEETALLFFELDQLLEHVSFLNAKLRESVVGVNPPLVVVDAQVVPVDASVVPIDGPVIALVEEIQRPRKRKRDMEDESAYVIVTFGRSNKRRRLNLANNTEKGMEDKSMEANGY
ncbi:no apical meristem protein [Tanacetum coccineum]